ncbi:MAG TPA: LemA family protein [Gemmatimonadota bacterium]|jgi:LemA protein
MTRSRLAGLALVAALTAGCGYNPIQRLDERAAAAKNQIEVQLQRRADLVPNLVETVRGAAQQELAVFSTVAQARAALAGAVQRGDPSEMADADQQLTGALGRLLAVVEAYPQLRSDQSFIRLQDELAGTENRIAVARGDYNEAVREYNAYIRQFPQVITAKVVNAEPREYFEVTTPGAREAPRVAFPPPAAPEAPGAGAGAAPPPPGGAADTGAGPPGSP